MSASATQDSHNQSILTVLSLYSEKGPRRMQYQI